MQHLSFCICVYIFFLIVVEGSIVWVVQHIYKYVHVCEIVNRWLKLKIKTFLHVLTRKNTAVAFRQFNDSILGVEEICHILCLKSQANRQIFLYPCSYIIFFQFGFTAFSLFPSSKVNRWLILVIEICMIFVFQTFCWI